MQADPKQRPALRRPLTVSLVAVTAVAVLAGYAYFRARTSRQERLTVLTAELQRVASSPDNTPSDRRLDATRAELQSLSARVPVGTDVGDLIKELSAALAEAGVDRREIVTQPTVIGRPFSRTPVSLRFECSFEQAFRVLKRVESCARLTRVDRLSVATAGEDRTRPLRVELEVSAFSRGAEEATAWGALE